MNTSNASAKSIFLEAVELPTRSERQAYLDAHCGADADLRREVDGLLQVHGDVGSFLESPPTVVAQSAEQLRTNVQESPSLRFLQPSSQPGSLGRLGRHEVLEVVGSGGMGVVLKAFDEQLQRVVAIKALADSLASNEHARRRFVREGRAAAAIRDDHVIGIYGVDETNGLPFLVMEYVVGRSLAQRLESDGPLPLADILRIGSQIARGLAAAHAQGLVHRDIKPANILLENGVERVKITDFGLAHAVDDVRTTQPGTVVGTPEYMSPEQARGERVDHRSDLFSLGCVLYAMCAGRPPFRADSTVAILRRICDDTPRPLTEINSDIPDWLAGIIDKLISKDAPDRFQTAAEIAELLEQCLAHIQQPSGVGVPPAIKSLSLWERVAAQSPGEGVLSPVSPSPSLPLAHSAFRTPHPALVRWSLALLLLLAATLALAETTGVTSVAATVIRIVRGDGTVVVEVDDPNIQVLIDGEELVINGAGPKEIRLRPGQHKLHTVKEGKQSETKLITITQGGRQVVRVARQEAVTTGPATIAPAPTGPVARRVAVAGLRGSLSPDARYLAIPDFLETGDLTVRDLATGQTRRLTNNGKDSNEFAISPLFSPDGQHLAYSWLNQESKIELRVIGLQGGEPQRLPIEGTPYPLVGWTPDGRSIVFVRTYERDFQLAIRNVADDTLRVIKSFRAQGLRAPRGEIKLSPDGRTIAYSRPAQAGSAHRDIFLLDVASGQETQVTKHAADEEVLAWTPEGKRLLIAIARQGTWDAWISPVSEDRSLRDPVLVKSNLGGVVPLGITSLGVFHYGLELGGPTIYTAALNLQNRTATVRPLVEEQLSALDLSVNPIWSPSGEELAFPSGARSEAYQQESLGRIKIVTSPAGENRIVETPVRTAGRLCWSSDGRSFLADGKNVLNGRGGIYQIDAQTGDPTLLIENPGKGLATLSQAQSSPDGQGIFYGQGRGIKFRDLATQTDREILTAADSPFEDQFVTMLAVSPDGRQIAVYGKEQGKDTFTLRTIPTEGGSLRELYRFDDGWYSRNPIVWTLDGRSLFFLRTGDNKDKRGLWQISSDGGEPRQIKLDGFSHVDEIQDLSIHPDGSQVAFCHLELGTFELWALENFLPPLTDSKPPAATPASAAKSP